MEVDFSSQLMLDSAYAIESSALPKPKIKTLFSGQAKASLTPQGKIDFEVNLTPVKQYGAILQAQTKGSYKQNTQQLSLERFLVEINVPKFDVLVNKLKDTQWGIPAPINDLRGNLSLKIGHDNAPSELNSAQYKIPIQFNINLQSKT